MFPAFAAILPSQVLPVSATHAPLPSAQVSSLIPFIYVYSQWLEDEFLGFLDKWERSVEKRKGFTEAEKKKMMLSAETLLGLRFTGMNYGKCPITL